MNVIVTGHRVQKLQSYDIQWIKIALFDTLAELQKTSHIRGYSGMASGVDLWFLDACRELGIRYVACPPFDEQAKTMSAEDAAHRAQLIRGADAVSEIKNSAMITYSDVALAVWDGNKGGTHNVVQQLIENKKNFIWINPVAQVVWKCFI